MIKLRYVFALPFALFLFEPASSYAQTFTVYAGADEVYVYSDTTLSNVIDSLVVKGCSFVVESTTTEHGNHLYKGEGDTDCSEGALGYVKVADME